MTNRVIPPKIFEKTSFPSGKRSSEALSPVPIFDQFAPKSPILGHPAKSATFGNHPGLFFQTQWTNGSQSRTRCSLLRRAPRRLRAEVGPQRIRRACSTSSA